MHEKKHCHYCVVYIDLVYLSLVFYEANMSHIGIYNAQPVLGRLGPPSSMSAKLVRGGKLRGETK